MLKDTREQSSCGVKSVTPIDGVKKLPKVETRKCVSRNVNSVFATNCCDEERKGWYYDTILREYISFASRIWKFVPKPERYEHVGLVQR